MADFNFDFGLSEPAFRERRIRWLDEEIESGFRYDWDRDELNDELFWNAREGLEELQRGLIDPYPIPPSPALMPSAGPSNLSQSFEQPPGYMEQPSAFALDNPPTESSFLESYPKGDATLTYQNDEGGLESIRDINLELIEQRSPILGMAFETGRSGPRLFLETLTSATVLPFVRYLYTGSYALKALTGDSTDHYEDVPTSVHFHCQLYRLGDIYDLPDLKSQAYVNVLRQCEFGCSSPDKPIDLCAAIRFIYENLPEHENLLDAIVNYCVSCFLQHRLAEDEDFKKLSYEVRPFHQALCKNSMARQFENETASAIVQMPFKPFIPETYASREDVSATKFDDIFHFHCNDKFDKAAKKRRRSDLKPKEEEQETSTILPLRPRLALPEWADEDYLFGSKRRASSVSKDVAPIMGGISQLRVMNPDPVVSEPEYEIVERPKAVVAADDSDSDSSAFVEIKPEPVESQKPLVICSRTPAAASASAAKSEAEDDSESEWTFI